LHTKGIFILLPLSFSWVTINLFFIVENSSCCDPASPISTAKAITNGSAAPPSFFGLANDGYFFKISFTIFACFNVISYLFS